MLKAVASLHGVRINPQKLDEVVEHYSIPAWVSLNPELVQSNDIESNKILLPDEEHILVSCLNPSTHKVWRVAKNNSNIKRVASTEWAVVIPHNVEDIDYINSALEGYPFQFQMNGYVTGTTNSHQRVKKDDFLGLIIPFPDEQTRKKIGELHKLIREKIASNQKISEYISDCISALFRSWFIVFHPVNAKAEGRLPFGMDKETAALFPDTFEDSKLGPIPTGWRILTLDEILDTIIDHRGLTPKKLGGDWAEEGYPAISAMNIKNAKIVKRENIGYISEELYHKWMKVELKSGDILLTSEAPLGEIYYLFHEEKMVTSQRVFGIRSNPKLMPSIFLRYYLDSHFGQYELHARASGSTVSGIRQSELRKIKIITPPLEIMNYFSNTVECLIENQYNCENQMISSEQTRDTLLPRLMSGELKVN
jgi:type I restriction enzyme, S subunit